MNVTLFCDQCLTKSRFDASMAPDFVTCRKCGRERPLSVSESVRRENRLDRCPVCTSAYFYREKDFNPWLGGGIIGVAIVGFLAMADRDISIALGILLAAAALDFAVYGLVPFRYVCYKCLSSMHRAERNPTIGPYDLGTAGRFTDDYERERTRPR